MKSKRWIC